MLCVEGCEWILEFLGLRESGRIVMAESRAIDKQTQIESDSKTLQNYFMVSQKIQLIY